jgi:phage gp36-like protein
MAYAVLNDLVQMVPEEELAQLTAEAGELPDPAVAAEAIARADAEIDSYLAVRYRVPVSPAPDRLKALSVDLALYHLYSRRGVAPEVRRRAYEDAVAFLKLVAAGQAVIEGADGEATSDQQVEDFTGADRQFSRDILRDW